MIHVYILAYAAIGFTLGCFHYFRNKLKNISGIAELVTIMMIWAILGIINIVGELREMNQDEQ
jgi:hypothetical protein